VTNQSHYAELLDAELPRVMQEVIFGLLGDTAAANDSNAADRKPIACRVAIRGAFQGEVIVSATLGLARSIAEQMFEDELQGPPTDRDARDAVREVSNIVAGNLKPLFGENNQLGLPEDQAENSHLFNTQLADASVEHATGVLKVVVYTSL
jgi:CheY-specific phosphatase CheX